MIKFKPQPRTRASTLQGLVAIVLPLTFLLVAVSLISQAIHQNAMRNLVGERDEWVAEVSAVALQGEARYHLSALNNLAIAYRNGGSALFHVQANLYSANFDQGVALFQINGETIAVNGNPSFWKSLQTNPELTMLLRDLEADPRIFLNPLTGKQVMLIAAHSEDSQVIIVGALTPSVMIEGVLGDITPFGEQMMVSVLDGEGKILFPSSLIAPQKEFAYQKDIPLILKRKNGITYVQTDHGEHVIAYRYADTLDWFVVTEETWEHLANPILTTSQFLPLVLAPALLLAALALWFGARQIVRPLQELENLAGKMAWGDFQGIKTQVGGIVEIQHLQAELIQMAERLEAAQQGLQSYIGAITQGQEEERRRLSRELHDDTIQNLIALKQRLQLVRFSPNAEISPDILDELENLAEQTIENLRRLTRALRPIYLEDFGLATALEALAGETHLPGEGKVAFEKVGDEQRLSPDIELALYRIAQEGLNNIVRHAHASHAGLRIIFAERQVSLEIWDDGRGFEVPKSPADYSPTGHFGLLGMYERAELIGAQMQIQSKPGEGVQCKIVVPLPEG